MFVLIYPFTSEIFWINNDIMQRFTYNKKNRDDFLQYNGISREEKCDSQISGHSGDTVTRTAKFRLAKQQLCVCITLFLYISSLHYCNMKLPNFTLPLYGVGEHNTKSFFFFFRYRLSFGLNPDNFANIWQIKWNWIRSMKFGTVRIYFLSEFSVCCHPKILLPWQRDVTTSPLAQTSAKSENP